MGAYRVTEAFTCFRTNPYGDTYAAGDIIDEKDPAFKGREAYLEPVEVATNRRVNSIPVEQATAAPGEVRDVSPAPETGITTKNRPGRRPAKKAAKKAT